MWHWVPLRAVVPDIIWWRQETTKELLASYDEWRLFCIGLLAKL